jgi:RNA polymerase sigma-70 factor (ECF subfamily)
MTFQAQPIAAKQAKINSSKLDDHEIVARIRGGETALYETIMRRYNQRLFRIARSIVPDDALAEDAVQEAYVAAFYALDNYQSSGSFAAWLSTITVNEARMSRRKRTRRPESPLADHEEYSAQEALAAAATPADNVANNRLAQLIETALAQLPETFRLVFVLRAIQQLSIAETAASLQIPVATVKTRYHRARNLMQQNLEPYIQEAGMNVFEFAGQRCDNMVAKVSARLNLDLTNK